MLAITEFLFVITEWHDWIILTCYKPVHFPFIMKKAKFYHPVAVERLILSENMTMFMTNQ